MDFANIKTDKFVLVEAEFDLTKVIQETLEIMLF